MDSQRHMTLAELAEREGVPEQTVYSWNSRGIAPPYLKIGRHVRYRLEDVLAWEAERLRSPRGSAA